MSWNIAINSRFRPFSYDEMVKPLVQYKEAYDAAEKDFSTLAAQTEAWKDIATRDQNPIAYNMYKEYSDALNAAVDDFSRGMNIKNRSSLLGLKKGYASSIVPIQNAYNTRLKQMEEQMKGKASGMVYASDAASTSLDEYIKNPSLQHEFADSNAGYKRVANAAAALSKQLSKVGTGRIDSFTKTFLQEHGYKDTEVVKAIQDIQGALRGDGNERGMGILHSILENEMQTSGVSRWKDVSKQEDYFNRIAPALYNAVGQTDIKPMEDYGARLSAQMEKEKQMALWKKAALNTPDASETPYRTSPVTFVDTDKKTRQMQSDIDFLREVRNNPAMIEKKASRYVAPIGGSNVSSSVGGTIEEYSPTSERLANISKRYGINLNINSIGANNFGEAINNLEREIRKSTIRSSTYIVNITDPSLIAKSIKENSLSINRRTGNTGIHTSDGDSADVSDVVDYLTKDSFLEYDPAKGLILTGINSEGKTKSFVLDPEVVTGASIVVNGRRRNRYQQLMEDINTSIDEDDADEQEKLIDGFMKELYYQFNSIAKRQGSTLSSKEE